MPVDAEPAVLAAEIVEDYEAVLAEFSQVAESLHALAAGRAAEGWRWSLYVLRTMLGMSKCAALRDASLLRVTRGFAPQGDTQLRSSPVTCG